MNVSGYSDLHQMAPANDTRVKAPTKADELRQATDAFEGLFLQQIMKTAREASLGDDLMGGSGVETMQGMLDEKFSQLGAGKAGLGIGKALYQQFAPMVLGIKGS